MQKLIDALRAIGGERVHVNEAMAGHTTFRIGGPADILFFPASADEFCAAMDAAKKENVPVTMIGNGSNLLVRDGGIRGLVIAMGEPFAEIRVEGNRVFAQAGARLSKLSAVAQEHGLSGLEFASGIPGSVGGGCAMNAGAYGGQLSDVLASAEVLLDGELRCMTKEELEMGYRTTLPLRKGGVVLTAEFELQPGDPQAIAECMKELNARRRDKQPLNFPSAGSAFKRPEGYFAGALIEQCGLKGFAIGGAQVSEKHAGFVVNTGKATARDVQDLLAHVQKVVKAETGVELEPEVRILGEEA